MTRAFREPGTTEYPAYDWDVIWHFGMPKISFRNTAGEWKMSSDILDDRGCTLTDGSIFADAKNGTKIHVLSGKTYVLTGERRPHRDHPQLSMLYIPEPEPEPRSWFDRLLRRGP